MTEMLKNFIEIIESSSKEYAALKYKFTLLKEDAVFYASLNLKKIPRLLTNAEVYFEIVA